MVQKSIDDTNGQIGQFCFQCHTPLASKLGMTEIVSEEQDIELLNLPDDKRLESSVSCVARRALSAVNATENVQLSSDYEKLYREKVPPEALEAHPLGASGFFWTFIRTIFFAGAVITLLNPRGAKFEANFSEGYASNYNGANDFDDHQSFADCNMKTDRCGFICKSAMTMVAFSLRMV